MDHLVPQQVQADIDADGILVWIQETADGRVEFLQLQLRTRSREWKSIQRCHHFPLADHGLQQVRPGGVARYTLTTRRVRHVDNQPALIQPHRLVVDHISYEAVRRLESTDLQDARNVDFDGLLRELDLGLPVAGCVL